MAQQVFNVPFPQGNYMFWTWTTQAGNNVIVSLADSGTTYINQQNRQSNNPLPPNNGFAQIQGTGLQLTVNVPASNQLILSGPFSGNISSPNGTVIGQFFNVAIEDGSDGDFNDIWVSLVAWNTQS